MNSRKKICFYRAFIIKVAEVYKYYDRSMIDSETISSSSSSTQETINETNIVTDSSILSAKDNIPGIHVVELIPHDEISINDVDELDDEIEFQDLYLQYANAMEEKNREKSRRKQLEDVLYIYKMLKKKVYYIIIIQYK